MSSDEMKEQQTTENEVEINGTESVDVEDNSAEDVPSNAEAEVSAGEEVNPLSDELNKQKDQLLRLQAEMENVRRRAGMDVEKAHKFALEKFTKELLPVVDSLEKASESIPGDDEAFTNMRQGVDMTLNLFLSTLSKFKVERLDPLGEPFDPQFHEAMSLVEAPDAEPNSVIAVMQKGYTLNGRLVRPAMVMVSKAEAGSQVDEKA